MSKREERIYIIVHATIINVRDVNIQFRNPTILIAWAPSARLKPSSLVFRRRASGHGVKRASRGPQNGPRMPRDAPEDRPNTPKTAPRRSGTIVRITPSLHPILTCHRHPAAHGKSRHHNRLGLSAARRVALSKVTGGGFSYR